MVNKDGVRYSFREEKHKLSEKYGFTCTTIVNEGNIVFFDVFKPSDGYCDHRGVKLLSLAMYADKGMKLLTCHTYNEASLDFAKEVYDGIVALYWQYINIEQTKEKLQAEAERKHRLECFKHTSCFGCPYREGYVHGKDTFCEKYVENLESLYERFFNKKGNLNIETVMCECSVGDAEKWQAHFLDCITHESCRDCPSRKEDCYVGDCQMILTAVEKWVENGTV